MNRVDPNIKHRIAQLVHRPVRDLAWALLTPPLFSSLPQIPREWLKTDWLAEDLWDWLHHIDQHPDTLYEHLKDQRATRLGIYFEQLLSFYFSHHPTFTLISKNLQANGPERTIGEYDFIVLNNNNQQYYHIEVAVKFYLGFRNLDVDIPKNAPLHNWHNWLGPNKKDTLAIKMRHLLERQLRLSEQAAGKEALQTLDLRPEQLNIRLLMTGRFYYPKREVSLEPLPSPQYCNTQLDKDQHWFSAENYINQACIKTDDSAYILLPRQQWMSDINKSDIENFSLDILSLEQLLTEIKERVINNNQQLHIAEVTQKNVDMREEIQRFFILPK